MRENPIKAKIRYRKKKRNIGNHPWFPIFLRPRYILLLHESINASFWLSYCCALNVSHHPPKFICRVLTSKGDGIRGWRLWKVIRSLGRCLINGISAPIKERGERTKQIVYISLKVWQQTAELQFYSKGQFNTDSQTVSKINIKRKLQ